MPEEDEDDDDKEQEDKIEQIKNLRKSMALRDLESYETI